MAKMVLIWTPDMINHATVTAMLADSNVGLRPMTTRGYYSQGDGGATVYYYDANATDTVDGGLVMPGVGGALGGSAGTGRYFALVTECNAKQFGAKGDGVTDDLAALQACSDAASANGLPMFIPAGTYLIGDGTLYSHRWLLDSNLNLRGAGVGKTIIQSNKVEPLVIYPGLSSHKTNAPMVSNRNYRVFNSEATENITVSDITFQGQRSTTTFQDDYQFYGGLCLSGIWGATVERCEFKDFGGDGFLIDASHLEYYGDDKTYLNRNILFFNNKTESCLRGGCTFISGKNMTMDGNRVTGYGIGLHIENGDTVDYKYMEDISITNNVVYDTTEKPFWYGPGSLALMTGVKVIGNTFKDSTGSVVASNGPLFNFGGPGTICTGNTFEGIECSGDGAMIRLRGGDGLFANNTIRDCSTGDYCIEVMGATTQPSRMQVIGNTFENVVGQTGTGDTNSIFIVAKTSGSYLYPEGAVIANNTATISGYYYGLNIDRAGVQINNNYIETTDGLRGIYNGTTSGLSSINNNTLIGWSTGIYRLTEKTTPCVGNRSDSGQWASLLNQILMNLTTSDAPYFDFRGTADADATSAISTLTTSGATTHHIQVDINGTKAWIAVSTNNPS